MRLGHAARGVEDELHVVQLPLDLRRQKSDRVCEKNDRNREQRGGQAIRAKHEEAQHEPAPLPTVIEWQRNRLAPADPFPKCEDHREREQREPMGMEKNHGWLAAFSGLHASTVYGVMTAAISSLRTLDARRCSQS